MMNTDRLTIIERRQARIDRRNLYLEHLLEMSVMLRVTALYYTVDEATEEDWINATRQPGWRTEVTVARLLRARKEIADATPLDPCWDLYC